MDAFNRKGDTEQAKRIDADLPDLARATGDGNGAAELYRRAAESLQDFHF